MQMRAMGEYAAKRGWTVAVQVKEVGAGASQRQLREQLLEAARRREIDVVLVWRLDRWGRSLPDLVSTLEDLNHLGVGFVSLTEALDLTTPTGRAMAGLLSVFAAFEHDVLRERVRAGFGRSAPERKAAGETGHCRTPCQPDSKAVPRRRQQSRNRPSAEYRADFRAPHSGLTYFRQK